MKLTRKEKKYRAALERRRDHLQDILEDWQGSDPGRAYQELAALVWALEVTEEAARRGILNDLAHPGKAAA